MVMQVEKDHRAFDQGAKQDVRAEEITLPDKFADRKRDTERLRDDLARHALVVRKHTTMGLGRRLGVLLHCGTDKLIEVKEECPPDVRLVLGREHNWDRFGLHLSFLLAAEQYALGWPSGRQGTVQTTPAF
jgi:hypothetical protein